MTFINLSALTINLNLSSLFYSKMTCQMRFFSSSRLNSIQITYFKTSSYSQEPYLYPFFFLLYIQPLLVSFSPQPKTMIKHCSSAPKFFSFKFIFPVVALLSFLYPRLFEKVYLDCPNFHSCLRLLQAEFHSSEVPVKHFFTSSEFWRVVLKCCISYLF